MWVLHRRCIVAIWGLMLALATSGCGWVEGKPVSVAAHVWPGYELMFLARNEGELDAQRVKLVETASATASLQALAEGRVDGVALTLDEILKARAQGVSASPEKGGQRAARHRRDLDRVFPEQ